MSRVNVRKEEALRYDQQLKLFLEESILPLIPGLVLEIPEFHMPEQARQGRNYLAENNQVVIFGRAGDFVLYWERTFRKSELTLLEDILENCFKMEVFTSDYKQELVEGVIERAIARTLDKNCWTTIKQVLDMYGGWSSQTYEGNRIAHNIGIDLAATAPDKERVVLSEYQSRDFLRLTGSSRDCLLVVGGTGNVIGLDPLEDIEETELEEGFQNSPSSMARIAAWAKKGRVAVSLTRNGEILVFRYNKLFYARRRGAWSYYPHVYIRNNALKQEYCKPIKEVRIAVYQTALDMAYNRKGACIGIVEQARLGGWLPTPNRLHSRKPAPDTLFYKAIIGNTPFQDLPREIRAELCSIDGATIIDPDGKVLAVGAILKTGGNPEGGGGRTAAARTIAKYGLGLKVSNDGYSTLFALDKTKAEPEIKGFKWS